MIMKCYCIRDRLSGDYGSIMSFKNETLAKRSFSALCSESKFGDDFELYYLGDFDTESGKCSGFDMAVFVKGGVDNET